MEELQDYRTVEYWGTEEQREHMCFDAVMPYVYNNIFCFFKVQLLQHWFCIIVVFPTLFKQHKI